MGLVTRPGPAEPLAADLWRYNQTILSVNRGAATRNDVSAFAVDQQDQCVRWHAEIDDAPSPHGQYAAYRKLHDVPIAAREQLQGRSAAR
jgi:hypothetical protein